MFSRQHDLPTRRPSGLAAPSLGLTLIELAVVLAVLAVLVATALPSWSAQTERRRLLVASADVVATLQWARSEAASTGRALRATVRTSTEGSCLFIYSGRAADASACQCGVEAVCASEVRIERVVRLPARTGITLSANVTSMRYDPATATTTPTGTLRLASAAGAIHHVVNLGGRVRSCSPAPTVSGQMACGAR